MSRRIRPLLAGVVWLALLGSAQAALADPVNYNGGPVAHSMTGVLVDWGQNVNPMYTNATSGDPGLVKYLSAESGSTGGLGGVLAQYMDSSGHNAANAVSYGQQYQITPSVSSTTIMDSQVQTELVNQIHSGALPRPSGNGLQTLYMVLFPSGDVQCIDSQTCSANAPNQSTAVFCAYHSGTYLSDGTAVLYAVLPDNTNGPMSQECGQARTPSGAPNLLGDQTSYLSHEWSETISDPLGNTWWVNNQSSSEYGNEIGDNCNQQMGSDGGWTLQLEWSNRDNNCVLGESTYNAPNASFLAPGSASPSQQVPFDASSSSDPAADSTAISGTSYSISSGISSYSWMWGDGTSTVSATPTASHSYASLGNYEVSLSVTDKLGFTSTVTHQIAVTADGTMPPSATTGAATGVSDTGATLAGSVNPENQQVQYRFLYGPSPSALSQSTALSTGPAGQGATAVSSTLSGLSASSTYYYRLDVVSGGQTYSGAVQSFTANATPAAPQTPIVATGSASQVAALGAALAGTIDPGGPQAVSYRFSYGTSPATLNLVTSPASGPSGMTSVPVSATLAGLKSQTTYYFRLEVSLGGQTYSGTVRSFTTLTPKPGVSTGTAGNVTSSGATISGTVLPNGMATKYHVEFGTSAADGHSTASFSAGSGTTSVPVTVTIVGLRPQTLYHYRLVATSTGGTGVGSDLTFRTAAALGRAPRFGFLVRSRAAIRAAIDGRLKVRFHCSKACSAYFAVTIASAHLTRFTPVAVTLARGHGRIRSAGSGRAILSFSPTIRGRLGHGTLKLIVFGYASSTGSSRSPQKARLLTLT